MESSDEAVVVFDEFREKLKKPEKKRKARSSGAFNATKHLWAGAVAAMVSSQNLLPTARQGRERFIQVNLIVGEHIFILDNHLIIDTTKDTINTILTIPLLGGAWTTRGHHIFAQACRGNLVGHLAGGNAG
ncbi:LOW QUALITY PROTEIN: hypothetical protein V2J09_018773 [Rumex salicifolius]